MFDGLEALYQMRVLPSLASGGIGRNPNPILFLNFIIDHQHEKKLCFYVILMVWCHIPGFAPIKLFSSCHLGLSLGNVCQNTANKPTKKPASAA